MTTLRIDKNRTTSEQQMHKLKMYVIERKETFNIEYIYFTVKWKRTIDTRDNQTCWQIKYISL